MCCYLTECRTSCALASGLAGRGNHSSWCSSNSRRWPLSCSWHTTVSSLSHPLLAASPAPSVSSLQSPTSLSPAPDFASSRPSSALQWNTQTWSNTSRIHYIVLGNKVYMQIIFRFPKSHQDCASFLTTLADAATVIFLFQFSVVLSVGKTHGHVRVITGLHAKSLLWSKLFSVSEAKGKLLPLLLYSLKYS